MMLTIIAILFLIYIHQQSKKARYDRLMKEREEQRQIAMINFLLAKQVEQQKQQDIRLYIEEMEQ